MQIGSGLVRMDSFWTDFKAIAITSKNLPVQYEDDAIADVYRVFAVDGSVIYVCVIYKGTVPDNCGITQVQNDADKTDFETNYEPTANGRLSQGVTLDGSGFVSAIERATYAAEVAQAGANNRDMISIFNPSGSGKVIRVWEVWGTVPSSSGTSVIVPFEMRLATAITTGSTVTAGKYDQDDPDPSAVVRQLPTGITDHSTTPKLYTWVEQINTAQGSTDAHSHVVADPSATSRTKPIVLREGQGLYLRQIVNNTSTFRMGLYWTEE